MWGLWGIVKNIAKNPQIQVGMGDRRDIFLLLFVIVKDVCLFTLRANSSADPHQ